MGSYGRVDCNTHGTSHILMIECMNDRFMNESVEPDSKGLIHSKQLQKKVAR